MKKKSVWTILWIAASLSGTAVAQTARELFNPPAREYIVGNTAAASNLVALALQKYPEDEKLLKLKELIDQQQQQQDQQQNQPQDQQDQQQDTSDPADQTDPESQPDQPEPSDPAENSSEQEPQQQPRPGNEMSLEEAERLLDAMRQNEQDKRLDLRPFLGQPVQVEKDW